MRIYRHPRPAKAAAVDYRGVIQRVAEAFVALAHKGSDSCDIGQIAGREEEGVLGTQQPRQTAFELALQGRCPTEETRGTCARPKATGRGDRTLNHRGMGREIEVVVRTQQDVGASIELDGRPGRPVKLQQAALQARGLHVIQLAFDPGELTPCGRRHAEIPRSSSAMAPVSRPSSSVVIDRGGISTSTSPNGRRRMPWRLNRRHRFHATRRSAGNGKRVSWSATNSMPTISPHWRISPT